MNFLYDVYVLTTLKHNNSIACLQNGKKIGYKAENQVSFNECFHGLLLKLTEREWCYLGFDKQTTINFVSIAAAYVL